MWATVIIATLIGVLVVAILVNEVVKKKQGKSSCACGGSCGTCGACPHKREPETK